MDPTSWSEPLVVSGSDYYQKLVGVGTLAVTEAERPQHLLPDDATVNGALKHMRTCSYKHDKKNQSWFLAFVLRATHASLVFPEEYLQ